MKKLLSLLAILALCVVPSFAQQALTQSFTTSVATAPPAVVAGQSFSTSTATGAIASTVGGSVAAGSYRVCVTFFSLTNTETPCSTDTAATSVVTTTGSTSTLTVQPPVAAGGFGNIVGYRVYVGASGGAAAAETLQTLTATICTLSTSPTASCSLNSPAVFTSSTNFAGGGGGPSTPGTLITPALSQQAVTTLFENSGYRYHSLNWVITGTAPSACTVQLFSGTLPSTLSGTGTAQTCTSSGSYALPTSTTAAYWGINVSTLTPGDTTTVVSFTYTTSPFPPTATLTDGVWTVPLGSCNLSVTTGAFAAAAAPAGANPAPVRVAAGNQVLQGVTSAAANVLQLECDVTPPARSSSGKGITVTGIQLYYGVQTTALTSITAPTVNTVTYPATGAAAAGTVASAGGSLTVLPATLQLATTTTGQCYSENIAFGTPVSLTTALQRLTLEEIFNQTGAAATQLQVCGVQVFYNNNPI